MNKTAFTISIALTTFVLFAVAGIVFAVRAADKPQAAQAASSDAFLVDPTVEISPGSSADQALVDTISQREAAYQDLINQANTRLEQMQEQQKQLQDQLAALQDSVPPEQLTETQAAEIASNYVGHTEVYSITLVTVAGEQVYQVNFDSGEIVYVNMAGQVVGYIPYTPPSEVSPTNKTTNPPSNNGQPHDDDDDDD